MRKMIFASIITIFLAVGLFSASGQAPAQPRGVLSVLHVGQPVSLKEAGGRFEIGVFDNLPGLLGHKVVEVGDGGDYLVVQDVTGVSEIRIPMYSVKSVVTLRIGASKPD